MDKFLEQYPIMIRTKDLIKRYGLKKSWIADKIDIPNSSLSRFISEKSILSTQQVDKLIQFMDNWETCMEQFAAEQE